MISSDPVSRLSWRMAALALRAAVLAGAALLASCGGGSQYEAFHPERLFTFGDEASTINTDGSTYSVNGLDANGQFDCSLQPIWTQLLATNLGLVFPQCNPTNVADPQARTWAAPGAQVADLAQQIAGAEAAAGSFTDRDLATVFIGANDILALYAQYPQRSEADLVAEAASLGEQTAQQVNRLIGLGPKVIVVNLPNLGLTPYAAGEQALHTDTDRSALIARLVAAFNQQMGIKLLLDGRYVGLVQLDERSQVFVNAPKSFGFVDVATPACTVALPNCTTATLVPDATAASHLWADDRWFSPGGHYQLAVQAVERARNNPF